MRTATTATTASVASLERALAHAGALLEHDPAGAAAQAERILRATGQHPQALLILGVARNALGDVDAAVEILGALARSRPDWALAHMELGIAQARAGRTDDALGSLRNATNLQPDLPRVWLALGDALSVAGDVQAAGDAYVRHVHHSARDGVLLRAAAALQRNRLPDAESLLRPRLKAFPTDVAAMRMLAEVAGRLGEDADAISLLERCLELAPGFHAARQNYAQMLNRTNRHAEALAEAHALLALEPDNPGYRNLKAVILCRMGDYAPAIAIYDRLMAEHPDRPRIWMSYGNALKAAGQSERCIDAYRKSIALDPTAGESYWSLANLKTYRFSADDRAAMRVQSARSDLDSERRMHFEFALAKALEDEGDYAEAFARYAQGNRLRLQMVPYSAEANTTKLRRTTASFDAECFARHAGVGCDAPDPIFIVGLPRAGSTLVEQILSSHSQVEGTMELPVLPALVHALHKRIGSGKVAWHEALHRLDRAEFAELGRAYLVRTRVHRRTGARHFIDKLPNNFAHVGLIHLILPNARIVDARRHPLACCFSAFKQHFARGQNFTYSLEDIGRYYRDYVTLMDHFDAALPGRVHRVFHEAMVEDAEAQIRLLLAHCGLPFEEGCLRFHENPRAVATASAEQVRRPINRDGLEQWRHFEPWLDPLKQALGPILGQYPVMPCSGGTT
ncbi:MAG: sulfotransferase [Proteobacteria bacterium]|nr:sulfotransferase [Pseudomonadota bacterium]